jgi:hypothetical protein
MNSRFTPQLNGNKNMINDYNIRCTGANKWVFSILIGIIFFLLSNSLTLYLFIYIINKISGKKIIPITHFPGLIYNLLMTVVFVVVLRLILW